MSKFYSELLTSYKKDNPFEFIIYDHLMHFQSSHMDKNCQKPYKLEPSCTH